jgi:hypothetical protein
MVPPAVRAKYRPNDGACAESPQPIASSTDASATAGGDDPAMSNLHDKAGHAVEKFEQLEHTADVGESEKTPWIELGNVWVVAAVVVAVVLLLSMIAYWLA